MSQRLLPLQQVAAGMRLATDVRDSRGAILLAAGGELNESLLAALRRRGIEQVSVVDQAMESEAEREAQREAIRIRLAHLFRQAGDTEADRLLFEAMLDYRLGQLA